MFQLRIYFAFFYLFLFSLSKLTECSSSFDSNKKTIHDEKSENLIKKILNDELILKNLNEKNEENEENETKNYKDKITEEEVEEILNALEEETKSKYSPLDDIIPMREKKKGDQQNPDVSETDPLVNHRRKTFLNDQKENETPAKDSCLNKAKYSPNEIIDSKNSIQKGANLVKIEYISATKASVSLNGLQDSCMNKCCNDEECDSALLSMIQGEDGYRCYLWKCNGNCLFVKHKDYMVLRLKSPEQLDASSLQTPKSEFEISTGHKDKNEMGMGNVFTKSNTIKSMLITNFSPEDRVFFSDKSVGIESTYNITLAIIILVAGISLVVAFFVYLILSTKYVRRRISWIKNMKESKNLDVEADYLINGMYL